LELGTRILCIDTYYEGKSPRFLTFQVELIVEHILLHCVFYKCSWLFFCVTVISLSTLFLKFASRSIIDYINETGFYCNILVHVSIWISIIFTEVFTVCILFVIIKCINIVLICGTFQFQIVFNMSRLFLFNLFFALMD